MNYISHIYQIISYGTSKQTWWKMLFLKQIYTRLKQLQKMISHSKNHDGDLELSKLFKVNHELMPKRSVNNDVYLK